MPEHIDELVRVGDEGRPDLLTRGVIQAMKVGTKFAMPRRIESLTIDEQGCFVAAVDDGENLRAKAIVVATGVQYRKLPLARLSDLEGAGVYYAATEAEARFCDSRPVVVIGAGNSAGQAAMHLSRRASHVHVLVRGPSLAEMEASGLFIMIGAAPNTGWLSQLVAQAR